MSAVVAEAAALTERAVARTETARAEIEASRASVEASRADIEASRAGIEAARKQQEEAIARAEKMREAREKSDKEFQDHIRRMEEMIAEDKQWSKRIFAELDDQRDERRALIEALLRLTDRFPPPPPDLRSA